jgi:hypothetical protein
MAPEPSKFWYGHKLYDSDNVGRTGRDLLEIVSFNPLTGSFTSSLKLFLEHQVVFQSPSGTYKIFALSSPGGLHRVIVMRTPQPPTWSTPTTVLPPILIFGSTFLDLAELSGLSLAPDDGRIL